MQWSDEGVILSVRVHGEAGAVLELFTREHGRHLGLVHGGRSRKLRPILQTGNHVDAEWKARLADHLGHFTVELRKGFAAQVMDDPAALAGMTSIAALARLLPERDPHPNLFEVTLFVLGFLDDVHVWPALLVRWELVLLEAKISSTFRPDPAAPSRRRPASPTRIACWSCRLFCAADRPAT